MKATHYSIQIKSFRSIYKDMNWPQFCADFISRIGEYIETSDGTAFRVSGIFHSVKDLDGTITHIIKILVD